MSVPLWAIWLAMIFIQVAAVATFVCVVVAMRDLVAGEIGGAFASAVAAYFFRRAAFDSFRVLVGET